VINIKKCKMIFEKKPLCIVIPLDPMKGSHYTKLVHDYESDDDLDYIYKITVPEKYWVNPILDGRISWECKNSCTSDFDEEIE